MPFRPLNLGFTNLWKNRIMIAHKIRIFYTDGVHIMEIKRLGENKIRCALTEAEIRGMGFEIDEIIGNSEMTQKFMRVVIGIVEEQENINMENISPMVKAELLSDHSMAITFGGESDVNFKSLVDTVSHLMSQISPEKLEEFKRMGAEEKQSVMDEFLNRNFGKEIETEKAGAKEKIRPVSEEKAKKRKKGAMICALRFLGLEDAIRMSRVCFPDRIPKSSLYKLEDDYFLMMDFTGFSKEEMRPFAFGAVEYDNSHFSESGQISYIMEHGKCIVRNEALQMLMQL